MKFRPGSAAAELDPSDELQYLRLTKEIDNIKGMVINLQRDADN
jgi:hypothetical protein